MELSERFVGSTVGFFVRVRLSAAGEAPKRSSQEKKVFRNTLETLGLKFPASWSDESVYSKHDEEVFAAICSELYDNFQGKTVRAKDVGGDVLETDSFVSD